MVYCCCGALDPKDVILGHQYRFLLDEAMHGIRDWELTSLSFEVNPSVKLRPRCVLLSADSAALLDIEPLLFASQSVGVSPSVP